MTVITVVRNNHATSQQKNHKTSFILPSQSFLKVQLDTFDNRCNVFRAAFCNVFFKLRGCVIYLFNFLKYFFERCLWIFCCFPQVFFQEVAWFFSKINVSWNLWNRRQNIGSYVGFRWNIDINFVTAFFVTTVTTVLFGHYCHYCYYCHNCHYCHYCAIVRYVGKF